MSEFRSKQTRQLTEFGERLVEVYNREPGSSGPYANPESLEAVIDELILEYNALDLVGLSIFQTEK